MCKIYSELSKQVNHLRYVRLSLSLYDNVSVGKRTHAQVQLLKHLHSYQRLMYS